MIYYITENFCRCFVVGFNFISC